MRMAPLGKLKLTRTYERCRMEQMGGWELAHIAAQFANKR